MGQKKDFGPAVRKAADTIHQWCPGWMQGQRTGHERKIRSPIREDKTIGSFSINEDTGEWYDFATTEGGDALTLYARIKGLKNGEARAEIMGEEYDPADDYFVEPGVLAANIASLANEELKTEYMEVMAPVQTAFKLSRYGEMAMEPPKWLIKGILEDNSLGVVFGASGHGKSYLVLDMAACVASGMDFHGRKTKQTGAVIYIAGEGHAGLTKRLKAWELYNETSLKHAPLYISHRPAALCDDDFMAHVKAAVEAIGMRQRVALIIVDTWARNMAGDENSTVDTTKAIRAVDDLRAFNHCTGLIVHHSGQAESERGRGSSALRASLDVEYRVEIKDDQLIVKNTKMKDGDPPDLLIFNFEQVDIDMLDDDGDPVYSAALEQTADISGIIGGKKKMGKTQSRILETLNQNSGSMLKKDLFKAIGNVKERGFFSALKSLLASGHIEYQDDYVICIKK